MTFKQSDIVVHAKRGSEYVILYTPKCAKLESSGQPCYIYRDPMSGVVWCRDATEMEDGRFRLKQGESNAI